MYAYLLLYTIILTPFDIILLEIIPRGPQPPSTCFFFKYIPLEIIHEQIIPVTDPPLE